MPEWAIGLAVGLFVLYLLSLLLIPWILLKKTTHPTAAVAWILGIIFVPYIGAFLALVFGSNRVERHRKLKRQATVQIRERSPALMLDDREAAEQLNPLQKKLARLTSTLSGFPLVEANAVQLLPETKEAFDLIEKIILEARHSVHIEFYIWRSDEIGKRIGECMIRKAREGVAVRFIYDGIGSIKLGRSYLRKLREAGVHVAPFLPTRDPRERWTINLRNHRKIIVVDGQVGFTGGMNVGDEYLGRDPGFGYWRDTQLTMRGPAVLQLQEVFAEDWYYATGEKLTGEDLLPDAEPAGDVIAQVISGGPDQEAEVFHSVLFAAITEAEEKVVLATSYFVPPDSLAMALETAARTGVHVRLLVAKEATYLWTLLAGRSYYDRLLNAGVEVYEYHKGLYHAKTLAVDGCWSLVGTPNFDMRSMVINFEVGLAMYDEKIAAELESHFERDIQDARRVMPEEWSARSTTSRLGERFARLFAPIL